MFSFSFLKESYIFPEFVLLFDCSEEKIGGRLLGLNYFELPYFLCAGFYLKKSLHCIQYYSNFGVNFRED
jgi:hypothetical protein